jgi:hypothetical protein
MTHEEAGAKLGAWCRRQGIAAEFQVRRVRDLDVLFVILRAELNGMAKYVATGPTSPRVAGDANATR